MFFIPQTVTVFYRLILAPNITQTVKKPFNKVCPLLFLLFPSFSLFQRNGNLFNQSIIRLISFLGKNEICNFGLSLKLCLMHRFLFTMWMWCYLFSVYQLKYISVGCICISHHIIPFWCSEPTYCPWIWRQMTSESFNHFTWLTGGSCRVLLLG